MDHVGPVGQRGQRQVGDRAGGVQTNETRLLRPFDALGEVGAGAALYRQH